MIVLRIVMRASHSIHFTIFKHAKYETCVCLCVIVLDENSQRQLESALLPHNIFSVKWAVNILTLLMYVMILNFLNGNLSMNSRTLLLPLLIHRSTILWQKFFGDLAPLIALMALKNSSVHISLELHFA